MSRTATLPRHPSHQTAILLRNITCTLDWSYIHPISHLLLPFLGLQKLFNLSHNLCSANSTRNPAIIDTLNGSLSAAIVQGPSLGKPS